MSQLYSEDGRVLPVTLVKAGPMTITQVKTDETDGYTAIQVGFEESKKLKKPQQGHLKDFGNHRTLRELRVENTDGLEKGQTIGVAAFSVGEKVDARGLSKGKGFQGVVKRYNFRGGWASHGGKHNLRQPGSIGSTWPQRVLKGKKMAGRMGGEQVTVRNLEVVHVDEKENIIALKGAVPGARGTLIEIRSTSKDEK